LAKDTTARAKRITPQRKTGRPWATRLDPAAPVGAADIAVFSLSLDFVVAGTSSAATSSSSSSSWLARPEGAGKPEQSQSSRFDGPAFWNRLAGSRSRWFTRSPISDRKRPDCDVIRDIACGHNQVRPRDDQRQNATFLMRGLTSSPSTSTWMKRLIWVVRFRRMKSSGVGRSLTT